MHNIVNNIVDAASRLHLEPHVLLRCDDQTSHYVVEQTLSRFVDGNPRVWWHSLKGNTIVKRRSDENNSVDNLSDFVPAFTEKIWFIPEREAAIYSVFDATLPGVISVLKECPYFEYYLVGKTFGWLLVENDHNEILYVEETL